MAPQKKTTGKTHSVKQQQAALTAQSEMQSKWKQVQPTSDEEGVPVEAPHRSLPWVDLWGKSQLVKLKVKGLRVDENGRTHKDSCMKKSMKTPTVGLLPQPEDDKLDLVCENAKLKGMLIYLKLHF